MVEIKWTDEAHRWLRDIYDYIAADNPAAAQKVVSGIYEKAQVLRSFSEIGHRYRVEDEGEIRILLYGHIGLPICSSRQPVLISWVYSTPHLTSTNIW